MKKLFAGFCVGIFALLMVAATLPLAYNNSGIPGAVPFALTNLTVVGNTSISGTESVGSTVTSNLSQYLFSPVANSVMIGDSDGNMTWSSSPIVNTFGVNGSLTVSNIIGGVVMTPNTTATVTYNSSGQTETVYDTSSSTIANLSITLPSTTKAGETVRYVTAGTATIVTISGTVSIGAAVTTLAANSSIAYQAINNSGSFIRIQ